MGTLENIAELAKKEKITKTAQILVGNFMGNDYSKSKLYDKTFSHEFRKGIKEQKFEEYDENSDLLCE